MMEDDKGIVLSSDIEIFSGRRASWSATVLASGNISLLASVAAHGHVVHSHVSCRDCDDVQKPGSAAKAAERESLVQALVKRFMKYPNAD